MVMVMGMGTPSNQIMAFGNGREQLTEKLIEFVFLAIRHKCRGVRWQYGQTPFGDANLHGHKVRGEVSRTQCMWSSSYGQQRRHSALSFGFQDVRSSRRCSSRMDLHPVSHVSLRVAMSMFHRFSSQSIILVFLGRVPFSVGIRTCLIFQ